MRQANRKERSNATINLILPRATFLVDNMVWKDKLGGPVFEGRSQGNPPC